MGFVLNRRRLRSTGFLAMVSLLSLSCEITNPGRLQDVFLNREEAWEGLVNGMGRSLADVLDEDALRSAVLAREVHPTGSGQIPIDQQLGTFHEYGADWRYEHRARWVAEDGIRRLTGQAPHDDPPPEATPDPELLAQAYLWAGYANRLLGELWCEAAIDAGEFLPSSAFLERAVDHFTSAIDNAASGSDVQLAGYAGRASAYVDLGEWESAVADAGQVADDHWAYELPYYFGYSTWEWNDLYWSSAGLPAKAHTVWNTPYAPQGDSEEWASDEGSYYAFEPNDPRLPIRVQNEGSGARMDCCGEIPWWPQTKHDDRGANIELSSGAEMRLIEAEYLLLNSDVMGALTIINNLRADVGLTTQWDTSVSLDSAWAILKRERGIELWLEARRLPDLRRWVANDTPGALDPLEMVGAAAPPHHPSHLEAQALCFPVPEDERVTNPNSGG
ncbi:RagB/SusD family nutrient uptake outer membrane protein [Gemmatimonadota bacterium]